MRKVILLSLLLTIGLVFSQTIPLIVELPDWYHKARTFLTMSLLAFIMIYVGREFKVNLKDKKKYLVDYGVAATAAGFPWIFCTLYFMYFLMSGPETSLSEAMLVGRFAAPTSAGILFSMLAAAGLAQTWTYRKAKVLAIFDDLDTILFLIPLKAIITGFVWQLGFELGVIVILLVFGLTGYRRLKMPHTWPWILTYALVITSICEILFLVTLDRESLAGAHIEVLLPAFVLGCMMRTDTKKVTLKEPQVRFLISCVFMLLVGMSLPLILGDRAESQLNMSNWEVLFHVLVITLISNLGKMFAIFCYKAEATFRERLAVSISMFPRGEVGAGVLAVALSYGIQGSFMVIGFLSLALNLLLTGVFIMIVTKILDSSSSAVDKEKIPLKQSRIGKSLLQN